MAVEAALEAGQGISVDGVDAVPNPRVFSWLDEWFDLSGNGKDYFVPFPLPGGVSRHRRDEKILAQGTMSTAIRRDLGGECEARAWGDANVGWSPPDAIKRAFSGSLTTTVFSQRRFGSSVTSDAEEMVPTGRRADSL